MECLLPYLSMVTVPHTMVGLERMLDYRGVGLERFHCIWYCVVRIRYFLLWLQPVWMCYSGDKVNRHFAVAYLDISHAKLSLKSTERC